MMQMANMDMDVPANEDEIEEVINEIMRRTLETCNNFCCPYCAEEYLFEFTLRDHLMKKHKDLLESDRGNTHIGQFVCPFCEAGFNLFGLLPKHIINSHGNQYLQKWHENEENIRFIDARRETEPSITYALCSPGLSDVYESCELQNNLACNDSDQVQIKSILKKPSVKINRFIHSPASVSIRRSKNEIIRKTSVRRELRFDLPSLENSSSEKVENDRKVLCFRNFFKRKKIFKREKANKQFFANIITSTPISLLDSFDNTIAGKYYQKRDSLHRSNNNLPFAFGFEMYQCAKCKTKFSSNHDLILHLNCSHRKIWCILRPQYQCGQCSRKFFSNKTLVSHCFTHNSFS